MAPKPTPRRQSAGTLDLDHSSGRHFFGLIGGRTQQPQTIHQSHDDARNSTRRLYASMNSFDDYTFDDANNFPTRATDLRHVDQSINLMDAETANYKAPRSDYVFAMSSDDDDSADYSDDDDTDDAYKNYILGFGKSNKNKDFRPPRRGSLELIQDGLNALRQGQVPRRFSDPDLFGHDDHDDTVIFTRKREPKHHSMSFLTDLDDCSDRRKSLEDSAEWGDILLLTHRRKNFWRRLVWSLIVLLLVGTTILTVVFWDDLPLVRHGSEGGGGGADTEDTTLAPTTELQEAETAPPEPVMTRGAIARRRMVLKHVLEKGLLHHATSDHAKELDLSRPTGQKGLTWMTATDVTSMRMLDHYHFYHHPHTLHPEPIISGKHVAVGNKEEREQDNAILERYVYVVFYFVAHPDCNPKTCQIH